MTFSTELEQRIREATERILRSLDLGEAYGRDIEPEMRSLCEQAAKERILDIDLDLFKTIMDETKFLETMILQFKDDLKSIESRLQIATQIVEERKKKS